MWVSEACQRFSEGFPEVFGASQVFKSNFRGFKRRSETFRGISGGFRGVSKDIRGFYRLSVKLQGSFRGVTNGP